MEKIRFRVGDRVRVKEMYPHSHHRTVYYVKGKTGVVNRYFGKYKNPEDLAYGGDGSPLKELYWVAFDINDLWDHEAGRKQDKLYIEIYEHWLEPV